MHLLNTLYVTTPESRLRLDNDTLRVELEEETRLRVPLHHLQSVVCFGHVSLSTPLMHKLAESGIALVLLNTNGRFMARLEGAVSGNVLLRQAQHRLSIDDPARALTLARAIVAGKLKNQRQVLLRGSRDAKSAEEQAPLDRAAQDLAASLRPKEITGAAAHYACVTAYVMLTPNNAPNNTPGAGPIFGYNPYLEGSFGPGVFGFKNTYNASYQYGVQSNCMSCHALAIADTNSVVNVAAQYTTDQTIDLRGSYFKNQVSVDFAWSVQSAFIRDTIPYWDPQYGKKAMPPKMK